VRDAIKMKGKAGTRKKGARLVSALRHLKKSEVARLFVQRIKGSVTAYQRGYDSTLDMAFEGKVRDGNKAADG